MTPQEFHYDFRLMADEVASLKNKSFTHAEIDWLLNRSQEEIVRSRLNQNNILQRGFEMNQKRIDDLKGIMVKYPEQPLINLISHEMNIFELDLNLTRYPYYFFIRGSVNVVQSNCTYKSSIKITQHDDINEALSDPFNQSSEDEILANFGRNSSGDGSAIYFYANPNQQLTTAIIEYLKKPNKINIGTYTYIDGSPAQLSNTDLSEHLHPEIVNNAVRIAAGIMSNSDLYNAMQAQLQVQE